MTSLARVMELIFILSWCVATAAFIYGTIFWYRSWGGPAGQASKRRWQVGYAVFIAAVAVGFIVGGIAQRWGGGWR